ncbi:MAG: hypothetical protein D6731_21885 [Planctomycetota bacterium]|nr:MAG: hypothetical protein D6731_21885 [Planctomycetota bacterium]
MRRRTFLLRAGAALAFVGVGCAGGPPRHPRPPRRDESLRRERFALLGAGDDWSVHTHVVDSLRSMGGVADCRLEEETGKYWVVYDPRRTHRDAIAQRVQRIGEDLGLSVEALFDER